jgi:2-oxoglutarate ferredoxin oxidoreductase subunit delta
MNKLKKDFQPHIFSQRGKKFLVFTGLCKGCGLCVEICPQKAIHFSKTLKGVYQTPSVEIDLDKCNLCGLCQVICPESALKMEK